MKKFTLMLMAVMVATLSFAQAPLRKAARTITPQPAKKVTSLFDTKTTRAWKATQRAASDYTIITDTPAGEQKTYRRSGDCWIESNQQMYTTTQSGTITVVFDGKDVYFKNPVAEFAPEAWVKGTLGDDGKTITVPLFQNLYYVSTYDACLMTAIGKYEESADGGWYYVDPSYTEVTYTLDGETLTLNGTSEDVFYGIYWTDDKSWQGYGEWNTVLTEYVPDYTLVTPPDGLTTTDMPLSGKDADGNDVTGKAKVGIDGTDIYFQGLIASLPDVWLKGTLADNEVTIPVTYAGQLNGTHAYAAGYASGALAPITLVYDAEANTYEVDGYLLLSSDELAFSNSSLIDYYTGLFLGERPAMVVVPEGLETKEMPFTGTDYDGEKVEGTVNVGFDGNDVYIQGLLAEVPEGWIKGVLSEDKTTVTFPIQYVGQDYESAASVYLMGGEEEAEPVVFSYDATSNMFTSQTYIFANGRKDIIYFYSLYEPGLVIGMPCDATWVAADQGYANQQEITKIIIDPDVTFGTLAAGDNTTGLTPKYYNSGTSVRLYAGNTLSIDSEKEIAKLEFYFTGNENQMLLQADRGTYELEAAKGTWTGQETSIVFSVPNESGKQARIARIDVTYFDYSTTLVTPPADLTTEEYLFIGTDDYYEAEDQHPVLVGFDGNDVYFQGLSLVLEDAWVKGSINDGKVTIPGWFLGEYQSIFGSYNIAFGGAEFTYDAEKDQFTCAEYKTYAKTDEEDVAMDEYSNVTITKIIEKAAKPAMPEITSFKVSSNGYVSTNITIPLTDVNGDPMLSSKLSYQLFTDINGTVAELVFDPADYENLTEEMTVIPYSFDDDWDIYKGGSVIYLNQANYADWNKIGVKSIYTGGGETNESDIFWYTIKEVDGINAINSASNDTDSPLYNLQGMRVKNPTQKGIYIRNGRKEVKK